MVCEGLFQFSLDAPSACGANVKCHFFINSNKVRPYPRISRKDKPHCYAASDNFIFIKAMHSNILRGPPRIIHFCIFK